MSSPVEEWIEKAEEDFHVALSLRRSRRHPAHNATCFHAQQCVEKYLKALLEKRDDARLKQHSRRQRREEIRYSRPVAPVGKHLGYVAKLHGGIRLSRPAQ